jgi:hypothetical protein
MLLDTGNLDTGNKNMYGLGVVTSTGFEILGHFLLKVGQDHHMQSCLKYYEMLLDTRNKNMHGLEVGISTVF